MQFYIFSETTTGAHNLLTTVIEVLFFCADSMNFRVISRFLLQCICLKICRVFGNNLR